MVPLFSPTLMMHWYQSPTLLLVEQYWEHL
jgi:hypothetical protein